MPMKRKILLGLLVLSLCTGATSCVGYADFYEDYPYGCCDGRHHRHHKKPRRRHKKHRPPRPAPPPPVYHHHGWD